MISKLRNVFLKVSSKQSFLSKSFEKFVCSVKHNRFKVCLNHLDGFFIFFVFSLLWTIQDVYPSFVFFSDLHKHSQKMSSVRENVVCLQICFSINRAGHNWNYVYSLFQTKKFSHFGFICLLWNLVYDKKRQE